MSFTFNRHKQALIIELPLLLGAEAASEFKDRFSAWVLEPVDVLVLDFKKTQSVERVFYQVMIGSKKILKANSRSLVSINVSSSLQAHFREIGLSQVFNPIADLDVHLRALAPQASMAKPASVQASPVLQLAQPFLRSTRKVFEVQLKTQLKALAPTNELPPLDQMDFISHVNLNSPKHVGRTSIIASRALTIKIYQALFGDPNTPSDGELTDCLSELMNMIYGQAKIELNQSGFDFKPELPKVMSGAELSHFKVSTRESLLLPFHTEFGQFVVEIYLAEQTTAAKAS
jgi:chemotaxis protein CheX